MGHRDGIVGAGRWPLARSRCWPGLNRTGGGRRVKEKPCDCHISGVTGLHIGHPDYYRLSAMSTTQPIALPNNAAAFHDYPMADGSFSGSSGSFNPASYARHFLGSPISWRQGSFASRFLSDSPSTHLGSHEYSEPKYPKMSSSIDSDRGSILNALNVFDREGELCRNYTCCGLHLNDMHALVEHLEEVHFGAYNPSTVHPQAQMQVPYASQSIHPDRSLSSSTQVPTHQPSHVGSSHMSPPNAHTYPTPFDPDDMELELDLETMPAPHLQHHPSTAHSSPSSGVPTPPDTPITTPLSTYPAHTLPNSHLSLPHSHVHPLSQPASPLSSYDHSVHVSAASTVPSTRHSSPTGTSTRPNLNLNLSAFQRNTQYGSNSEEAFNSYTRYASDYSACMPGTQYNNVDGNDASAIQASWHQQPNSGNNAGQCVPPALLFSTSACTTPLGTPDGSRVPSPSVGGYGSRTLSQSSAPATPSRSTPPSSIASGRSSSRASSTAGSTTLSRPASSLLLSKPFRCPKPNCNKSYKQANGLKYHMTHGSCNFAPPKDLEHVKDLLERKRRDREREREKLGGATDDSGSGLGRSISLGNVGESDDTLDLSNISESELREVEREAEKRMKPFACGVGDCQRRYKNMNGLRYHYQHSGDHGAVGLALLASGQHECLQGQKRNQTNSKQNTDGDKDTKQPIVNSGLTSRGSSSVPVSRAASRTGTPQPLLPSQGQGHYSPTNTNVSNIGVTHAQPFTPPQAGSQQQLSPHQSHTQTQQQLAAVFHQQYAAQLQHQQQQQYQQYVHMQGVQMHTQQQPQPQMMLAQAMYSNGVDLSSR
ncbi:hypothetical protein AX15_001504 [Amanita polypyramis BW_CC]|nr:hypothetical protein AX15_001504 [Amanita polypyramis BW_CC]